MPHTLFENARITPIIAASGTIVGATANGTSAGTVFAGDYEYHAYIFAGSVANTGTMFLYGVGASQTNILLGSMIFGSSNGNIVWEVKSDALLGAGTAYNYFGMNLAVDTGGTLRGGLFCLSHEPRAAGTTPAANGWAAVGTSLA